MSEHSSNCSEDRLRGLLRSDDDCGDDHLAVKHIAECQRCQLRLEELAAEPDAWSEARESLLSDDDLDQGRQAPMSGRPWAPRRWQHRTTAWTESMSRQLLSPPSHPEMLGRIGRYEVERLIGAGGMGVVFKAFDTELNRPVAVKVLAPILAGSGAARQRFAREARAAAAVVHEHVVSIHNVETEGESPFLVMQYVAGESLQGRIDHEGALDVCEILRIGMQTAAGLAAAHAQGLVHRDVKPSNILLEKGVERALLTDFGLARASDDASLTHTGYHPGTPQYMSPEQARGDAVDSRSDLFSLGSVIYTMCTGRAPFRAETSYGILRRITDTEPRSIREINPNIPDWLESIVAKLMAKQVDDRFASADEVAELLEDCLAHVQQPTAVPLPESLGEMVLEGNGIRSGWAQALRSVAPDGLRRSANSRRPPIGKIVAAAAFAFLLIFAGILIVLELNKGTLTIECEADNVPVRIKQGDKVAKRLSVTRGDNSVRIAAGQYLIEIDGEMDGLMVANGRVTLRRGGRELVTIIKEEDLANRARKANLVDDQPRPKEAQIPETDEPIPEPPRDPLFENLSPQQQVSLTDPPLWVSNVSGPPGELDWPQRTGPIVLDNERLLIGQSILDLRTGKEIERLSLATDEFAPTYLRLSADRKFLMVCGQTVPPDGVFLKPDAVIQVWDIAQRKQVGAAIGTQLLPITWNGSAADISADGKVVAAGGRSGKIALWSVVDAQLLKEAPFKSGRLDAIALSPDGQWLVVSDANDVTYWKWQTNEEPRTIHVGRKIDSLAFSPDSRYLAEGPDAQGDIQLRDMTTLEVVRAVKDKFGSPFIVCAAALKFSADGSKLIAGNEAMVDWRKLKIPYRLFIWDVESGKLLRQIATPNHLVRGVDISPDGKHIAARLDSSYVAVWSTEKEEVSGAVDSQAKTMPVEIVLPHQFRLYWPGAMERSPTTARFAVPVSEPSQIRLDEIVGHLGLEIGVTIEPTDYASSDEFSKRETGMRIKISADDLAALKTSKLWTFTYEKEQGTVIAVIKITAQQRPVTPIADIKELNGTWRLVDAHLVRDQALGLPFHDLEGYKSARIAIDGPEWRHVRQGNELFRTLEATYDLTASPQKVDLKFTFRESEKHERRLIELHGDELITAKQIVSPADGFPGSFDEPMVLIERYQRVGVVINRNEVDETVITISLGTSDGIRLNQQFQVTDASSVLGTVEAYEIGKHESYARVVEWSADRPIRKGDRLIPIGATDASQALDAGFPSDAVLQEMHDLLSEETRLKLDLRYVQQFLEGGKLFAKTDAAKILENARRKELIEARQQEITNRLKVIHESELGDLRKVAENAGLECAEEPLYGQSSYGVIVYANTLDRIQKDELLLFHAGSLYRTRGTIRPLRTTGNGFFLRPNVAIPSGKHIAMSCIQDAEEERENVKNGFMPDSNRARNPSRAYRANVYDRQSGKPIQASETSNAGVNERQESGTSSFTPSAVDDSSESIEEQAAVKPSATDWESTNQDLESYRIDLVPFESRSRQLWDSSPTINEE